MYRSQVALTITKEDYDDAPPDFHNIISRYSDLQVLDDYVIIYWKSVGWYNDIKNSNYLKDKFYYFLRVGDNYDDIEEIMNDPFDAHGNALDVYIERTITWNK
jgi:hypothetical protein